MDSHMKIDDGETFGRDKEIKIIIHAFHFHSHDKIYGFGIQKSFEQSHRAIISSTQSVDNFLLLYFFFIFVNEEESTTTNDDVV